MKKQATVVMTSAIVGAGLFLSVAANAAVDYSALVTAATSEINAAITAALPVLAIVLGATVGVGLFKRFAR